MDDTRRVLSWSNPDDRARIISDIKSNKVVITSTDTVLGFLCKTTTSCFEKLNKIKQRSAGKPYLLLVAIPDQITDYVDPSNMTSSIRRALTQVWPGSMTGIFRASKKVPEHLVSPQGTIALRCPGHDGLRRVIEPFQALLSTSANQEGHPIPLTVHDIPLELTTKVASIIDDEPGTSIAIPGLPSTLVDFSRIRCKSLLHENGKAHACEEAGHPILVRSGAYPISQIEGYYGEELKQ